MEPFTIHCETCAARLKVRRASMINQVLACPKCGNMVRVIPPDDLNLDDETLPALPPQINHPQTPKIDQQVTANSQGDFASFEDIEDVIAKEQSKPSQPAIPKPPKRNRPTRSQSAPNPAAISDDDDAPLLPDQNWTSSKSQHRQKLILAIVGGVGILLLTIGGITAFIVNSGKPETAKNDQNQNDNTEQRLQDEVSSPKTNPESDPIANPDSELQATDNDTSVSEKPSEDESAPTESIDDSTTDLLTDPLADITAPEIDTPLVAPKNDQDETQPQEQENSLENPLGLDPLDGLGGGRRTKDPSIGASLDGGAKNSTRLGELNNLLSESGMSLSAMQDVADANRLRLLGKSKYYFEPPAFRKTNLRKALTNNISGIQYRDVDLRSFLRDSSNLVGTPISLHIESLQAAGLDWNAKINMLRQDLNVESSINEALAPLKMKKEVFEAANQIVVLAEGWNDLTEVAHQPHHLADTSPAGQASFVRRIRGMFDEKAWTDQTVIEMRGDELFVKQVPQVQHQIARLLEKLKAAQTLNATPNDAAAQDTLRTEWSKSLPIRGAALAFRTQPDAKLQPFILEVEKQANVKILIDWNSLSQNGWGPGTMVPGEFNEKNLEDTLHQLSRAMKVGYRAIDEKTFELLSTSEMDNRPELQVYAVKQILEGPLTSDVLMEILGRTFQQDGGLVQVGFDQDSQAIVVIAPQYIQVLFEAVLDQMRKGS